MKIKSIKNVIENKKGLSEVVTTVILIALVLVAAGLIWGVVRTMINKNIKSSESCFNIADKVSINGAYTCYNPGTNELNLSVSVGDLSIEGLVVSVSKGGTAKGIEIKEGVAVANVRNYDDPVLTYGTVGLKVPTKNSGRTYVTKVNSLLGVGGNLPPKSIQISPIVNGEQCGVADSLTEISDCALLA
jgi:flagellin-like protein